MKKGFAVVVITSFCCLWAAAQQKIELRSPKQQHTKMHLYDEANNFLLTLPLTFSMTDKDVLIMMVGNDIRLADKQSVWIFSEEMYLTDLEKNNRNVSVMKSFQNQNTEFKPVLLPHRQITIHREFDDGYQIIKKSAQSVFFRINDSSSNPQLTFYLQFYVAKTDSKYPYVFAAKCKPIEVELFIK